MTLASVQELLIQQQQKVQELAHELAAAKVLIPSPSPDPGLPCSGLRPGLLCPVHCIPWGPTLVFSHARYRAGAQTVLCREWRSPLSLCPFLAGAGEAALCLWPSRGSPHPRSGHGWGGHRMVSTSMLGHREVGGVCQAPGDVCHNGRILCTQLS